MLRWHVTCLHRRSCDCRAGRFMDGGLWIHPSDGYNVTQLGIRRRLREFWRVGVRSSVVGDEVEVLAGRGGDAERLLHQAVQLVSVAIRTIAIHLLVLITPPSAVWCLSRSPCWRRRELSSPALALHLAVGEKAARDSAGTPRFPIRPPPHAGFPLVPDEDRAGLDGLPLLL